MGERQSWNDRVTKILRHVRREGAAMMWLGFVFYGGGSAAIFYFMRNQPGLATAIVMTVFQMLVLFFGTRKMYPCIAGGFLLSIEANRDSVPTFEKIADSIGRLESDPENHPAAKALRSSFEREVKDGALREFSETMREMRLSAEALRRAAAAAESRLSGIEADAAVMAASARQVAARIDRELDSGLLDGLKGLSSAKGAPPDIARALSTIRGKNGASAKEIRA